jgi:hypothetical protein
MSDSQQQGRETNEPPRDNWRPPDPTAPLRTQEVDVSDRPKQILIAGAWSTASCRLRSRSSTSAPAGSTSRTR